jgi:hypothetical protein
MAVFNKSTLTQVSGFDKPIIASELVFNQRTFWNLAFDNGTEAVDLTGATIDAQIIRREISNLKDSRFGLTFDIGDYTPAPTAVPLTIANRDDQGGKFTLVIDSTAWGLIESDPDLDIASINGTGFSGRIKISFPANGATPAEDNIIFLLFLVRSDAIVN